ncbi:MAG: hypothetical protein IJ752_08090 [Alphaproteobacteria bacterium]|nr:hypothetical protein [Alphaproteobacteria bacterium]
MTTTVLNASSTMAKVKSWSKTSTDTYADSIRTARDMGQARLNYSRLNMITTLSENETEDWFSFTTTSRGKLRLTAINLTAASKDKDSSKTTATDELEEAANNYEKAIEQFRGQDLKVEIYQYVSNRQTLVATNEEGKGKQTEAFEQMMRGQYQVAKKGTYYVHVTTKDGKPISEDTLYALQVQLGDKYTNDYVTQEQSIDHTGMTKGDIALAKAEEAVSSATASGNVLAAQGASNLLSAGYTNMATLRQNMGKTAAARIFNLIA